jgi:hypothetical protein
MFALYRWLSPTAHVHEPPGGPRRLCIGVACAPVVGNPVGRLLGSPQRARSKGRVRCWVVPSAHTGSGTRGLGVESLLFQSGRYCSLQLSLAMPLSIKASISSLVFPKSISTWRVDAPYFSAGFKA